MVASMARRLSKESLEVAALYALEEGVNFTGLSWATGTYFGPASMRSELAVAQGKNKSSEKIIAESRDGLTVGDLCQTLHTVTVRVGESFESDILAEFPGDVDLRIMAFGTDRRMLVRFEEESIVGWVSYKTKSRDYLVGKKEPEQKGKSIFSRFMSGAN
eukprot:TRINITY_DN4535_c0_g1_i1.p2 TRINITY_DN4535_c0_g1~~TRINITY_DN4535_c0_g1_i1.p2  ORF type:complete len:160 (+),score=39.12 TRINITY_DN4535_c0_g1_i1:101-580(+)